MRVFVYEFVTGGGTWSDRDSAPPAGSLLGEGAAMVRALARDFLAIGDLEVEILRDGRLSGFRVPGCRMREVGAAGEDGPAFLQAVTGADWSVVIAPEFAGHLSRRTAHVEQLGGQLLSPSSGFVRLAADKDRTARVLAAAGIPTPRSVLLESVNGLPGDFPYPAVLKPNDGAGSLGVRLVADAQAAEAVLDDTHCWRLERYHEGLPASVAVFAGLGGIEVLPPGRQILTTDGRFQYRGGRMPLGEPYRSRAQLLGRSVAAALPAARGYFGIDLVLGAAEDGSQDVVIEVNPRLTTSYLGLRRLSRTNLAAAMLAAVRGERCNLSFAADCVEFGPDEISSG